MGEEEVRVNTLLYMQEPGETASRLRDAIRQALGPERMTVVRSAESLSERLRNSGDDRCVAVLAASTRWELQELLSFAGLLEDVPVFLLLPDRSEETLKLAHQLRPRYLITQGEEVARLVEVLRRKIDVIASRTERPSW